MRAARRASLAEPDTEPLLGAGPGAGAVLAEPGLRDKAPGGPGHREGSGERGAEGVRRRQKLSRSFSVAPELV